MRLDWSKNFQMHTNLCKIHFVQMSGSAGEHFFFKYAKQIEKTKLRRKQMQSIHIICLFHRRLSFLTNRSGSFPFFRMIDLRRSFVEWKGEETQNKMCALSYDQYEFGVCMEGNSFRSPSPPPSIWFIVVGRKHSICKCMLFREKFEPILTVLLIFSVGSFLFLLFKWNWFSPGFPLGLGGWVNGNGSESEKENRAVLYAGVLVTYLVIFPVMNLGR